jgi:hypothetical protein
MSDSIGLLPLNLAEQRLFGGQHEVATELTASTEILRELGVLCGKNVGLN